MNFFGKKKTVDSVVMWFFIQSINAMNLRIFQWRCLACVWLDAFFRLNSWFNAITGKNSSELLNVEKLDSFILRSCFIHRWKSRIKLIRQRKYTEKCFETRALILDHEYFCHRLQSIRFGYQNRICNKMKLIESAHMEMCQVENWITILCFLSCFF